MKSLVLVCGVLVVLLAGEAAARCCGGCDDDCDTESQYGTGDDCDTGDDYDTGDGSDTGDDCDTGDGSDTGSQDDGEEESTFSGKSVAKGCLEGTNLAYNTNTQVTKKGTSGKSKGSAKCGKGSGYSSSEA